MAKKKTTKSSRTKASSSRSKKTTKKKAAVKKKAAKKKVAVKKTTTKKTSKKKVTKKTTKKSSAKKVAKKKTAKKTAAKKVAKKVTKKKTVKSAPKPVVKKPNGPAPDSLEAAMEKEWTIPQLKRVKTGLTKKQLDEFLKLLLEKRAEIIGNVKGMEDERNASLGDIAHMPLHMADVGSDNFEQEFTLGLMESERERLRDIEQAIMRMREGYFGVCLESGRPIQQMRLEFAPWAKYCIDVARAKEKHGW